MNYSNSQRAGVIFYLTALLFGGYDYKKENEQPIMLRTEKLEKKEYICCKMQAKIKSILKMSGSYCPYCGVIDYGIE